MQKSKIPRTCRVRLGLLWVPENYEPRDSGSKGAAAKTPEGSAQD